MSRPVSCRAWLAAGLSCMLLAGVLVSAQRATAAMAGAASRFLAALSPEQRAQAAFAFDTDERFRWHFVPGFPRKGLPIKAMTESQRKLAHDLLRTGLSQNGYLTYTAIIHLETILRVIEQGDGPVRDPELYLFSVFGTPSPAGTWGWRVEGHHVSLHFTVVNGTVVASSPSFAGANPAEVRDGSQKGQRTLAAQEDTARALVMALGPRSMAVFSADAPRDIVTGNMARIDPLAPAGIAASALTAPQREQLMRVIDTYASLMAEDVAAERMARIRAAGTGNITFGWAGGLARGDRHYYRVQGPTFLIEFDNTQGNGNHVHSVWRDFNGDFGRDLLREHLRASAH